MPPGETRAAGWNTGHIRVFTVSPELQDEGEGHHTTHTPDQTRKLV